MTLKAGVVQLSPLYGQVARNLDRLAERVSEGAWQGAQLVVLPEMAWTGYLWPRASAVRPFAEAAGAGPGQDRMAHLARTLGIWLVYGFPEAAGDRLFNSQGLVDPEGRFGAVYRKTHLFEADTWWAEPGDTGYLQWPSPWGPLGSGICMDLNFPDLPAWHRAHGTAILTFSTNWLDQGFDVVPYWEDQLAGENGFGFEGKVLAANRGGQEFGVAYRGQSSVFEAGRWVAGLEGTDDGVLVVDLSGTTGPGR